MRRRASRPSTSRRSGASPLVPAAKLLGQLIRRGLPLWVGIALVMVGWGMARRQLATSPGFVVRQVHEPALPGWRPLTGVQGQPLLAVDVVTVAEQLRRANPQMKTIRVTRQWPSALLIEALPRRPVAQVRLREFFAVDEEGFVFPDGTSAPQAQLPIVEGVEPTGERVTPGAVSTTPRIHLALRLLDILRASPTLREEPVMLLNVADARQITFRLQRGVEVRAGDAEALDKTLERLTPVLVKLHADQLTPQYIDLRFADPVIGPR